MILLRLKHKKLPWNKDQSNNRLRLMSSKKSFKKHNKRLLNRRLNSRRKCLHYLRRSNKHGKKRTNRLRMISKDWWLNMSSLRLRKTKRLPSMIRQSRSCKSSWRHNRESSLSLRQVLTWRKCKYRRSSRGMRTRGSYWPRHNVVNLSLMQHR